MPRRVSIFTGHIPMHRLRPLAVIIVIVAAMALSACAPAGPNGVRYGANGADTPSPTAIPAPSSPDRAANSSSGRSSSPLTAPTSNELRRDAVPDVDDSPLARARRAVNHLSMAQQVGQLVMAPLPAGYEASSLRRLIATRFVGSVLITGNWNAGISGVHRAAAALQGYAPPNLGLFTATDQEGGEVQHLRGTGFTTMPSGVAQGAMSVEQLRADAAIWGGQLNQAGINVNLAPVTDTVQGNRAANAPIGALDRDFGLDASGNASHAEAFIAGMRDAGVQSVIKHYPGLGSVTGNTDFTTQGIEDDTTTLDGPQINAFITALDAHPAMVMASLATYTAIDRSQPAAFSDALINSRLRGQAGYHGVVISDSLSATALQGIPVDQLGVRLVEAGGDLACISAIGDVDPLLDGLNDRASHDAAFAAQVTQSAIRVLALKYQMGLAR